MKRALFMFVILCLIAPSGGCGHLDTPAPAIDSIRTYRDIPGVTQGETEAIEALKTARGSFSYGACLATEAFALPDGSLGGFSQMLCELLSELFGIEFVLQICDWDVLREELEEKTLDFTGELTPTEERMRIYSMTQPIAERMLRIFTPADTDKIQNEADIEGLTIGVFTNSTTGASIQDKYHVSITCVDVDNYDTAADMIKNGRIDAFVAEAVADPAFAGYDFIRSRVFFPLVHAPVSMTTDDPELAPVISVIDRYIDAGGLDRLYELYKKGDFDYSRYKLHQSFSDEERAYIEDLTRNEAAIAVAFEHDNYPVNFYNEKEAEYEGIAVDVLGEISRLTGIAFQPAVASDATWAEIYDMLNTGEIHMVAQLLQSDERSGRFLWTSAPYARSYYALMSRLDYPNLETYQVARATVGVVKESAKIDIFYGLFPSHEALIEYDTQDECLDALERGDIDLLMGSEYNQLMQINYREKSGFKINIKLDASLDSYFGFHKDCAVLSSIINKAQQYVQTGVIEIGWTGRSFDYSKRLSEERTRYLTMFLIIMACLLALTVFVLVKNVKLGKELVNIANHDALTGLLNRRYFMEVASLQMARSERLSHESFVAIYDLDHFKAVNDTYGHQAGDKVLSEIAQRVRKAIRPYDLLGRYGGEEFILLMSDTDKENVINAIDRIRREIAAAPVIFEDKEISVSASFGIAFAAPVNDLTQAIKYADEALYEAKKAGRNRVEFCHVKQDNREGAA